MRKIFLVTVFGLVCACAPSSRADDISFGCSTVSSCGATWKGSATTSFNSKSPVHLSASGISSAEDVEAFALTFTGVTVSGTSVTGGTVKLTDADKDVSLTGTVMSGVFAPPTGTCKTGCNETLTLFVQWSGTVEGHQFNSASSGNNQTALILDLRRLTSKGGKIEGVTGSIFPQVPEPWSLLLVGTGLLALGGIIRRQIIA